MRLATYLIVCLAATGLSGCKSNNQLVLRYQLGSIDPHDVIRVETQINVDPNDPQMRMFFATQPFRSAGVGVGSEVRDLNGMGALTFVVTHDATLGFEF